MWKLQKRPFLIDILTDRSILCWLKTGYKAFPSELKANLSGNHGRNRKCSFSQIRNLLKTNTSRISGLPKKWQTGGREKCLSAAELIEFLKVWLIRIPRFCVDDSDSVPILPLPIIFFCTIGPGSSIHKLYDLRSPNSQPSELGNLTMSCHYYQIWQGMHSQAPSKSMPFFGGFWYRFVPSWFYDSVFASCSLFSSYQYISRSHHINISSRLCCREVKGSNR